MAQSTQNLKADFTEVTASLLTESVALQRAVATSGNTNSVPTSNLTHDSAFKPESRDIWLNGLWFVSLAITLSVALVTGLIKQWLNFYISETAGTPKHIACTRQYRYMGLSSWGVSPIIEVLPLLMNTSLFLFLVGLILFLQGFSGTRGIIIAVAVLTSAVFVFYILSGGIPIWRPQCPYKTSLSQIFNYSIGLIKLVAIYVFVFVTSYLLLSPCTNDSFGRRNKEDFNENDLLTSSEEDTFPKRTPVIHSTVIRRLLKLLIKGSSMTVAEGDAVRKRQNTFLQVAAISDLVTLSTDPSAFNIGLQSLAGLYTYEASSFESALEPLWLQIRTCMNKGTKDISRLTQHSPDQAADGLMIAGVHPLIKCRETHTWATDRVLAGLGRFTAAYGIIAFSETLPRTVRRAAANHVFSHTIKGKFEEMRKSRISDLYILRKVVSSFQAPSKLQLEVGLLCCFRSLLLKICYVIA